MVADQFEYLLSLFDDDWSSGHLHIAKLLPKVMETCVAWFEATSVSLFLKQDDGEFWLAGQSGPESQVPDHTALRPGEGIAGKAISSKKALLIHDPREIGQAGRLGPGSAMIVPLVTPESGCIGVLNVFRKERAFTKSDLSSTQTLGRYVGLAVNNARLLSGLNDAVSHARAVGAELDAILANLGVGVLVVSEMGEVRSWNPEALALLKFDPQGPTELGTVGENVAPSLESALIMSFQEALERGRSSRNAYDVDADRAWSLIAAVLPTGGATITIQETTERERAQRDLARNRRLAEIGQMTAAIAHEIRNPLTGIRSAAQMVQMSSDEAGEFGKIIEEEALKLNALCDQFLEFAKPLQISRQEIDLATVLAQTADLLKEQFSLAKVSLDLKLGERMPTIQGDRLKLQQVLQNLLLNSLQACAEGDVVTVECNESSLKVADSGKGIEQRNLPKLFTPFFTTRPQGTGLGLSTVRKIVDAHGWRIHVQSELKQGTTFTIEFARDIAA